MKVQVYYNEHQGNRHYTVVLRRSKFFGPVGFQIFDITGGTDHIIKRIEDLTARHARFCQLHDFPVKDWTLGRAIKTADAPQSVQDMANYFEKAARNFADNWQSGDHPRRNFWRYAE